MMTTVGPRSAGGDAGCAMDRLAGGARKEAAGRRERADGVHHGCREHDHEARIPVSRTERTTQRWSAPSRPSGGSPLQQSPAHAWDARSTRSERKAFGFSPQRRLPQAAKVARITLHRALERRLGTGLSVRACSAVAL